MNRQPGPEKIGDVLRSFLESRGLANNLKHLEVYSAWEEVVGPVVLAHARVAGFQRHKLYIDVSSSAHMHELRTFYKPQILKDLRAKLPTIFIQDIVFRPAPIGRS